MQDRISTCIQALNQLGFCVRGESSDACVQAEFNRLLSEAIAQTVSSNRWFTESSVRMSLSAISEQMLDEKKLLDWFQKYSSEQIAMLEKKQPVVGIILAGNLPLVGFYDVLCALLCGVRLNIKMSSKDAFLLPFLMRYLCSYIPELQTYIKFIEGRDLGNLDALMATGSAQSIDAIADQWKDIPCLFRSSRTSIAVLNGRESEQDLLGLTRDVCMYYGMGCRSVNTLFLPRRYNIENLTHAFELALKDPDLFLQHTEYQSIINSNRAKMRLLGIPFTDAGSVLLVPTEDLFAPVGCLHYRFYDDHEHLLSGLAALEDLTQVVVCSQDTLIPAGFRTTRWGQSQYPALEEAPDGLDPVDFLLQLATSPKMS